MALPISVPRQGRDADKVRAIAAFFELEPDSAEMAELTGLSASSLGRLRRGQVERPRPQASAHIAVLAAFADEAAEFLDRMTGGDTPASAGSMRDWLHSGWVRTSRGRCRPIEALADRELAVEALNELRQAAE
jgi:hypothetical protein